MLRLPEFRAMPIDADSYRRFLRRSLPLHILILLPLLFHSRRLFDAASLPLLLYHIITHAAIIYDYFHFHAPRCR